MTRLGLVWMPRSGKEAVELTRTAEHGGFWGMGICDSPILYSEMYPVITECLANTERIIVGPNVTNPVSRHWTVHGAAARTFHELYPERYFLGIGAGDGAVHTVGLRPAKVAELEAAIRSIAEASPDALDIQVAAGGPRTVEAAGRTASGVIVGTGGDATAIRALAARAKAARVGAGRTEPFQVWALVLLNVVDDEGDVDAARQAFAPVAMGYARHAFDSTWEDKNAPDEIRQPMRERFSRYQFMHHAMVGQENPNAHLFDDRPDIMEYLLDRFTLIGTRRWCADRLTTLIEETGVDGVWMSVVVPEPKPVIERAAEAFADLLTTQRDDT